MRLLTQAAVVAVAAAASTYPNSTVSANSFAVTTLPAATLDCGTVVGPSPATKDVTSQVPVVFKASSNGVLNDGTCTYDVLGLADGTYSVAGTDVAGTDVVIDRKPYGIASAYTATVDAGEKAREIVLPALMFGTPTPTKEWTITSIVKATGAAAGFSAVVGKIGAAKLFADEVGKGVSTWTVSATDGTLTVDPILTVSIRGDSNAADAVAAKPLLTLGSGAGAQRFSATGNFYTSATAFAIKVTFSEPHTYESVLATTNPASEAITLGAPVASISPLPSNGDRTWTIAVTAAANTNSFNLPAGMFKRIVNGVDVLSAALGPITVVSAPTFARTTADGTSATLTAGTDKDYFYYIPAGIFKDANGAVEITSATTDQMGAGLRLLPGKLGRAAIQGKVLAVNIPAASTRTGCYAGASVTQVVFTIYAKDATGKTASADLCVAVETSPVGGSLSFAGSALTTTEGGPGVSVFADATITNITTATKLFAYLETPDNDADEELLGLDAGFAATSGTSAGISAPLFQGSVASGITDAASAQAAIRAVKYKNTFEDAVSTDAVNKRNVRLVLSKPSALTATATDGVALAVATRPINYKVDNDPPVLTDPSPATYVEGAASTVLFPGFVTVAVDDDDDNFRQATVTITKNCDVNDRLALSAVSTTVGSFWNSAKCQLTLVPAPGASTIDEADLQTALQSVIFTSNKPSDPNAGITAGTKVRTVVLAVTDDASNKHVAAPKVATASLDLTVTSTKSAPQFKPAVAYGAGGIFSSSDPNANFATVSGVETRKPVLVNMAGAAQTFTFDFNQVKDSVYAGGALVFTDSKTTYITAPADVKVGTVVFGANAFGTITVGTALAATATATSPSLYALTVTPDTVTTAGEFTIPLYYRDPSAPNVRIRMDFVIDVRVPACHLVDYNAGLQYPDPNACEEETKEYTGDAAATLTQGDTASQRGAYTLDVPAKSIASTSSVTLTGQAVTATQKGQLPNFSTPGSVVDFGTAVSFGPAGTKFTTPTTVCLNAGVIPSGFKGVLAVSSQIDVNDASKGYTGWELLGGQTVSAVISSDKICGELNHFSVVGVVLVPIPTSASAQKQFQMGASCPNGCSGKGFCRENGQCLCFDGFTGYDCAQRTCPADESWDVPADASVAHKAAECSSRGACDRKTGACACYPGFEGSACQRVACPNDCSGHGKCRALSDASDASIVDHRIQMCKCDAGYTGSDCSQRTCAFGDDPETVCYDSNKQKQRVTVDFGTLPAGIDGNSVAFNNLYDNNELSLAFTTKDGHKFYTPKVVNFWNNNAGGTLETALKSLPSFAVSDVTVASAVSSNSAKVDFDVEFSGSSLQFSYNSAGMAAGNSLYIALGAVSGNTVSGGQNLLSCDTLAGSPYMGGCSGQGCEHGHKQPRLFEADGLIGASFAALNANSVLQQPEASPITPSNNFDSPGVWGVEVVITVTSDGTDGGATYNYDTTVYGEAVSSSEEIPLPPTDALRKNVPIAYGLHLDFDTGIIAAGANQMFFAWRLPKCSVIEVQPASSEFEVSECSNRGVCDRKSGTCQCFGGYSGYNCGQQTVVV